MLCVGIQLSYDSEQECSVWHKLYQSVSDMKYLNPLPDLWLTATAAVTKTDCVGECRPLVPYRSDRTERTFFFSVFMGFKYEIDSVRLWLGIRCLELRSWNLTWISFLLLTFHVWLNKHKTCLCTIYQRDKFGGRAQIYVWTTSMMLCLKEL